MPWILIGYMFLFIHRPFEVWPWLGDLQIERVCMVCAGLLPVRPGQALAARLATPRLGFALAVGLCWVLSPWADYGQRQVEDYFKVVVFFGMLVTVANDEKTLKFMVTAFLVVMFVYMSHSLLEYMRGRHVYRMGIPRLIGVDKTLSDPTASAWPGLRPADRIGCGWGHRRRGCVASRTVRRAFDGVHRVVGRARRSWGWCSGRDRGAAEQVSLAARCADLMLSPLLFLMLPDSLQNRFTTIIGRPSVRPTPAVGGGTWRASAGMNVYSSSR
jgi:hypothetical protein